MVYKEITRKPVSGSNVWLGSDMSNRCDWIYTFNSSELSEINLAVKKIPTEVPELYRVTPREFPLPKLKNLLNKISEDLQFGRGFVLFRGIPVDSYSEKELAAILWGIGSHFGVGLVQSFKGDRLGHVIDRTDCKTNKRHMRNYELGGKLRMHTDLNNDIVALMMLQHAKSGGESRIASSMTIHNIILEEHPEFLEPLFRGYYFHFLNSKDPADAQLTDHRVPVFINHGKTVSCHFNPSPIDRSVERAGVKLNKVESEAVQYIEKVALRPGVYLDMTLEPGDIQFLNNHVIMHGRTHYEDYTQMEKRRHLLRLWLRSESAQEQPPETHVHQKDNQGNRA